jgi:amino acid transporter
MHPRWGTPANSILFAGALMMAMVVLAMWGVHSQETYQVLTGASLTHYEIAYLAMFAVPLAGRTALRRKLPMWLKWTSGVGLASTCFALLISAYPFVSVVNARAYAAKILGTIVLSNALAFGFYVVRTRARKRWEVSPREPAAKS